MIYTIGPIVQGPITKEHERLSASCYTSGLNMAAQNGLKSIAFCYISTGVFMFPNRRAAEIAVETVRKWLAETGSNIRDVFNVYKVEDLRIHERILK